MKKKALVLAVGLAFATPTISAAKALPSSLVGVSFGEIQSTSYLNEPFNGIIPILFTDIDASKKLKIRLAPESVFQKVGADKLPILNSLKFHVAVKNNKPVIFIRSTQPIQMPFLSFVLEIEGPQGSIYQDYTTLLDPKGNAVNSFASNVQAFEQQEVSLRASVSSSNTVLDANRTLKVKSGDTLSQIVLALNAADVSLKNMVSAIHKRNPNAFVNNNINRLKAGAVLHIPTKNELANSSFKSAAKVALKNKPSNFNNTTIDESTYTIKRGDNLSKITRKLGHNGVSFTKMMNAIYTANPHAFSKNKINLLKVGKTLRIPAIAELVSNSAPSHNPTTIKTEPNPAVIANQESAENTKEFRLNGFVVEKGDTLAKITKQIGHDSIPNSKMMHAIYLANPDAFEKNNITTLVEGSIIRLPSIAEIEELNNKKVEVKPSNEPIKSKINKPVEVKDSTADKQSSISNSASNKNRANQNSTALNKLEKRVRELKRDLNKAHSSLTNLELSLAGKEMLLKQQSKDLSKLASTLESLNNSTSPSTDIPIAGEGDEELQEELQTVIPEISTLDITETETTSPINLPEMETAGTAPETLKSDILTTTRYMPAEINQVLPQGIKNKFIEYSQYMSGKELFASILALLFGLALVRYRRKISAYTNISYDHPKYYPPFKEEEAKALLKETPINYQETPLDSTKDIHEENKPTFSDKQIQECEDLANELIEDLEIKTTVHNDNADWAELDKACDDYIEEYEESNILKITDVSDDLIGAAEPEEMTFELFEALAEGVTNKKPNSMPNEVVDDTLIYDLNSDQIVDPDPFDDKEPMPFSDLSTLSKNTSLEKAQAN